MKTRRWLAALVLLLGFGVGAAALDERVLSRLIRGVWARGDGVFQVKPYLQLGYDPGAGDGGPEACTLVWQTADRDGDGDGGFAVDVRAGAGGPWAAAGAPAVRRVAVDGVAPF